MVICIGSKVILSHEISKLSNIGATYIVKDIIDGKFVILEQEDVEGSKVAISFDIFPEYFDSDYHGWTEWAAINDSNGSPLAWYRTNGKRVKVKTNDGFKAEASCSKYDKFNLRKGLDIAYARCVKKWLESEIDNHYGYIGAFERDLRTINRLITEHTK